LFYNNLVLSNCNND